MATSVLILAIIGLFIGGFSMAGSSRRVAMLDARISLAIAHLIVPQRMRRAWRRAEGFKKNAGEKHIQLIYKNAGIIAILLAVGLTVFLANVI